MNAEQSFLDIPEKKENLAASLSKISEKLERKRQRKLEKKIAKQQEESAQGSEVKPDGTEAESVEKAGKKSKVKE